MEPLFRADIQQFHFQAIPQTFCGLLCFSQFFSASHSLAFKEKLDESEILWK